jgi:mono/diheme cytochrome c family protein
MRSNRLWASAGAVVIGSLTLACSESSEPPAAAPAPNAAAAVAPAQPAPPAEPTPPPSPEDLAARGKSVYLGNCIACHSPDPRQIGAIGPEVAGSSHELLEARVLRAQYPDGYTPKRDTAQMVALPHLENDIDALEVFLAQ